MLRRLTSGSVSPVKTINHGYASSTHSVMPASLSGSRSATRARPSSSCEKVVNALSSFVAPIARYTEVVVRPLDRQLADGNPPAVRSQDRLRGHLEDDGVDRLGAERQVRVRTAAERTRAGPDVRRRGPHRETVVREGVLDAQREGERVARLRVEDVLHHDAARVALGDGPPGPADEPVDRVPVLGLGQCELVASTVELVRPLLDAVRPRHQHLSSTGRAHLVRAVSVEHVDITNGVRAQTAAEFHDDCTLVSELDVELLTGRCDRIRRHQTVILT